MTILSCIAGKACSQFWRRFFFFFFFFKETQCAITGLGLNSQRSPDTCVLVMVQESISSCCIFSYLSTVQFSHSVLSKSLRSHELQHNRPPCPSPIPGVQPNSSSLGASSQWYHPAISSSVVPFSSCPQSLPGSGSFPMSQLFACGGQSIAVSVSASALSMNTQDWSPSEWTGWILQSKGLSRVFSNTTVQKHQFFSTQLSSQSTLTSIHDWKNHSFD